MFKLRFTKNHNDGRLEQVEYELHTDSYLTHWLFDLTEVGYLRERLANVRNACDEAEAKANELGIG